MTQIETDDNKCSNASKADHEALLHVLIRAFQILIRENKETESTWHKINDRNKAEE